MPDEPRIIDEERIALLEEHAIVSKRSVETGRVRVRTHVETREEWVRASLDHQEVEIERVPIGADVDAVPPIREKGDVTIIPVIEERLVVEKRLVLVEEIHLRRTRRTEQFEQPVTLASQRAEIERHPMSGEEPTYPPATGA